MLAFLLSPIYIGLLIWATTRWCRFVDTIDVIDKFEKRIVKIVSSILFLLTICIMIGFCLPKGDAKAFFTRIGNYWLGVSLYLIISIIISEIFRFIFKKSKRLPYNEKIARNICVIFCALFTLIWSICGIINARTIKKVEYNITINKKCELDSLDIALIADTHFGYNIDEYHLKQVVDIVNEANVDLFVLAGDIFDNQYEAIARPDELIELFNEINTKYGKYCVSGNHDVEEDILCGFTFNNNEKKYTSDEMLEFINKANIKILNDEYELIDNSFYLYGRPDYSKPGNGNLKGERKSVNELTSCMDNDKPIILIDHQPREYQELEEAGIDLDLSGHTHDGQIWPTKYINDFIWDNPYGIYQNNNFTGIVTSGVGLFGPNMRTCTQAEVVIIHVTFEA